MECTLASPCRPRAFTLLEVLIVVVILGILAAIVIPQTSSARTDARNGAREADMRSVEKALELFNNDEGAYPVASGWSGDAPAYGGRGYTGDSGYIPGLAPTYMPQLPRDPNPRFPVGGQGYLYTSNGTDYKFLAHQVVTGGSADHPLKDPPRGVDSWSVYTPAARNW